MKKKSELVYCCLLGCTFPIDEETNPIQNHELVSNQTFIPNSKVILTSPNARKYLYEPLKTSQEKLNIEAIITTNLSEKILREALQVKVNGKLQTGKLGTVGIKAQQQDYDFEQGVLLEEGHNTIEIGMVAPNQRSSQEFAAQCFLYPTSQSQPVFVYFWCATPRPKLYRR